MTPAHLFNRLRGFALASVFLAFTPALQAAPINLTPAYPDLTTFNATLSYSYVAICANGSGAFGVCGTGGGGPSGFNGAQNWSLSYGRMTVTGNTVSLNPDGTGGIAVTDANGGAFNFSLTVVLGFNSTGTALSGILTTDPWSGDTLYTSAVGGYGTTSNPSFQSGTIVTGTPTNATAYGYALPFGYSGTEGGGSFEFVFNNVGGDMAAFGTHGGIIVSTTTLSHTLLTGLPTGETWDSEGINFWKTNFSASSAQVDTFVPVPGAVWLFGSALAGLAAVRRKLLRS